MSPLGAHHAPDMATNYKDNIEPPSMVIIGNSHGDINHNHQQDSDEDDKFGAFIGQTHTHNTRKCADFRAAS